MAGWGLGLQGFRVLEIRFGASGFQSFRFKKWGLGVFEFLVLKL